jgi:uncharacterized protein
VTFLTGTDDGGGGDRIAAPEGEAPVHLTDEEIVAQLIGREPAGGFEVVVRTESGAPAVIANEPFLTDGTPMPTRYWLVDPYLREAVSRIESSGGVRRAEEEVGLARIAELHARYAEERDELIPKDHRGPRPSGGVGGTRQGVKCLHAHLAWWLTGGSDAVGEWTAAQLGLHPSRSSTAPSRPSTADASPARSW